MDQKTQNNKKKIFSTRRFKYGAAATVFTAFFIAAVILMNVIVSAIDSKYSLYFDLTEDQVFSISETTTELVTKQLESYAAKHGHEAVIKISFLQARDLIVEDEKKSWVVSLAESYAERYPQIEVEYREDITTHPENYTYYTELGYDINTDTILVTNTQDKGAFRYLTFDSCLVYDENGEKVWAFQGEMKFNSAILYITDHRSPIVTFTSGHGESVPQSLIEILTNCGFTIETVDLTKDNISDESKILFICNPQKDLTYSESDSVVTEYTKISDYLNAYRSMVVIASPDMPTLPVLDELLASWGMEVVRNQVVMDDTYCHTQDNQMLYVNYAETETVAAALTKSLTDRSNPPRSLMIHSAPINILFSGDGETSVVEPVLKSSDNSYVEEVTQDGNVEHKGPFNLMAISSRSTYIDNLETYGHLLVIGSQNFTETNAFREQFGNTDIVYNMIRLLSDEYVAVDVHYKVLEDYAIDIDQGSVYTYGIITVAVIPLLIFALGTFVYIKRKHM
ncbi:MAG: Gldg family protein [Clostridia bacterium]|nr:Gldg family protein [Clostridia bacterium]